MRSIGVEGTQYAVAGAAGNLNNGDLTITELDRDTYGWPRYVSLVILTGDVAATAVLDVFSLHGSTTGTFTPSGSNLLVSHDAVAADATANDDKAFVITYDANQSGLRYFDAIVSNNVAANFVIDAAFWVMHDSPEIPPGGTGNYGTGSPKNG
ncbi:MAG: hypothetical protein HRU13_00115 [Phycisphaerales bacterium]|nr:hypothetical protein [Phycisphaerales bacterium]